MTWSLVRLPVLVVGEEKPQHALVVLLVGVCLRPAVVLPP